MIERIARTPQRPKDSIRAHNVLGWLDLTFDDLQGKRVLDVGADEGQVSAEAARHGVDVVSIDKNIWEEGIKDRSLHVIGDALALPFADESFDYVLSHAAPPLTWSPTKESIVSVLAEYWRVTKPGGEIRFGSGTGTLDTEAFEPIFKWWEKLILKRGQLEDKHRDVSIDFLKALYPHIERHESLHRDESEYAGHYYTIRKPNRGLIGVSQN